MGEAWFMSAERTMYPEALSIPVETLDLEIVGRMFDQIVCGPPCFGQLEEWQNWFHYLLPRLLPRAFRRPTLTYVAEWLAGGMFSQYPGEIGDEPYRGFQADVFATLGQALMSTAVWEGPKLKWQDGLFRQRKRHGKDWWYLDETSPPISALLFFCLKYLRPSQIDAWFHSVVAIECPLWRSQLIVWFTGAQRMLRGEITQPKQFGDLEWRVKWEWDHVLSGNYTGTFPHASTLVDARGDVIAHNGRCDMDPAHNIAFIPKVNLVAFCEFYNALLPRRARVEFSRQVNDVPLLAAEMGGIAEEFIELEMTNAMT